MHEADRIPGVEKKLEKGFHGQGLRPVRESEQGHARRIDVFDPSTGIDDNNGVLAGFEHEPVLGLRDFEVIVGLLEFSGNRLECLLEFGNLIPR